MATKIRGNEQLVAGSVTPIELSAPINALLSSLPRIIVEDGLDGSDSLIPGPSGINGATGLQGIQGIQGLPGVTLVNEETLYDNDILSFPSIAPLGEITITATGNIDDLDFGNVASIRMNNASLATIRGLKAGVNGQRITIFSVGAGQVDCAHQNAGSAAANRIINTVTVGVTPLFPGNGTATYEYDGTTARWRLVSHNQGGWINVVYASGDYTCDVGTWTVDAGDLSTYKYYILGKSMVVAITIVSSTLSSIPSMLYVALPGGYLPFNGEARTPCVIQDSTNTTGFVRAIAATSTLIFYKDANGSNYVAGVNLVQVFGQLHFELT